jgi:DNA-binding transcriptional regulator GbsR (MarR family)
MNETKIEITEVIYYDKKTSQIIDYFPKSLEQGIITNIYEMWGQEIPQKIIKIVSQKYPITATEIKSELGHSSSTIFDNLKKLEQCNLIKTEISYIGNKKRVIYPKVFFVTKNNHFKQFMKKFFQGMWVDSDNFKKIMKFLQKNPNKFYTSEEISAKTNIPVDSVEITMQDYDSKIMQIFSTNKTHIPFEKKTVYKYRK